MIKHLVSAALVALLSTACSQTPQHDEHATNIIDPRDERIASLERERDELKTKIAQLSSKLSIARDDISRLKDTSTMARTHAYLETSIFEMLEYIQEGLPEECSEALPDLYQDFYITHPVPSDVDWVEDW